MTREQILQALRRADALAQQGDVQAAEDARRLASLARSFDQPAGGVSTQPGAVDDLQTRAGVAARGALDTATFGLADELMGVFGAIDPQSSYDVSRDEARLRMMLDQADYPGSRLTGQIGGGVASGVALGGPLDDMLRAFPALRGSGLAARVGRGAAGGAIEGGAYGFGSGEGVDERFMHTLGYGALGGAVGGAVPVAAEAANMAVLRPIGGALGVGNERRAANTVLRAMEDAGATPDQIQTALRNAAAEGQGDFNIADVLGISGRRALAGATTQPGRARVLAENVLDQRQQNQTGRLAQFVEEAMDARNTRAQQEAASRVERGLTANVNYGAARAGSQPVDVRNVLQLIDDRIGPMGSTTVEGDSVDAVLDQVRRRLSGTVDVDGQQLPAQLSDFNRLSNLYGELSDLEQVARQSGATNRATAIANVKNELGRSLESASPEWRTANANFAAASRVVDAAELGQRANVGTVRFADVEDQVDDLERRIRGIEGLTEDEADRYVAEARQAFRTGYANRDLAAIEGARDTRNMANALFENDRQRANYGLLATDPELFFNRVGRESTMSQTRNAALGGSQTAANLADQAMVEGADIGIISNLLSGNMLGAVGQGAGRVLQAARGSNEPTREAIARALLSNDPNAVMRSILPAQRAQSIGRTAQAGIRGGLRGLLMGQQ